MIFEINKLMESEFNAIREIAWLVYRNGENELSREDVENVLKLLVDVNEEAADQFVDEDEIKEEAYDEGFNDGRSEGYDDGYEEGYEKGYDDGYEEKEGE